eukprot:3143842-Pyramimonas_sp.AAC.1
MIARAVCKSTNEAPKDSFLARATSMRANIRRWANSADPPPGPPPICKAKLVAARAGRHPAGPHVEGQRLQRSPTNRHVP